MAAPTEVDDPDALLSPTAGAGSCDKELRRRRKNPSRRLAVPLPEVDTFVTDGTTPTEMLVTEIASDLTSVKLLRLDSPLSLVPEPTTTRKNVSIKDSTKPHIVKTPYTLTQKRSQSYKYRCQGWT